MEEAAPGILAGRLFSLFACKKINKINPGMRRESSINTWTEQLRLHPPWCSPAEVRVKGSFLVMSLYEMSAYFC